MRKLKKYFAVLTIASLFATGCTARDISQLDNSSQYETYDKSSDEALLDISATYNADVDDLEDNQSSEAKSDVNLIDKDGYYYDLESVVIYLDSYGELPGNYITKKEARALGWEGGSVEDYKEGAVIGGDHFGNYEQILPDGDYTECDIDTKGLSSRGAKRLIFSEEGEYYYTEDHYDSFTEILVTNGQIEYGIVYK